MNELALRVTNCRREFVFACVVESILVPCESSAVSDVPSTEVDTS